MEKITYSAFFGKQEIKDKYIAKMKEHIAADELIRGIGFSNGKGCAVGCTLDSYNVDAYPTKLGIPVWVGKLEDTLFEGMSLEKAKPTVNKYDAFPLKFLELIPLGANLDNIKTEFMLFILESNLKNYNNDDFSDVTNSINTIIELYKHNCTNEELWTAAYSIAESAARAAAYAAARAEESTAYAAARAAEATAYAAARSAEAAEAAAYSAARSAEAAAYSAARAAAYSIAESAAYAAARSEAYTAARATAYSAARAAEAAAYDSFANKFLELVRNSK